MKKQFFSIVGLLIAILCLAPFINDENNQNDLVVDKNECDSYEVERHDQVYQSGDHWCFEYSKIPLLSFEDHRLVGKIDDWYGRYIFMGNDNGFVVYPDNEDKRVTFIIEEFSVDDPNTFELLADDNYFAKDDLAVYVNEQVYRDSYTNPGFGYLKIENADPNTFKLLNLDETTTANNCRGERCFRSFYSQDNNNWFYANRMVQDQSSQLIDSVKILPYGPYVAFYATDGESVFYQGIKLDRANVDSFESFINQPYEGCGKAAYASDGDHVYFESQIIEGADPETFENLISPYAKDASFYYKSGLRMIGVPAIDELTCDFG